MNEPEACHVNVYATKGEEHVSVKSNENIWQIRVINMNGRLIENVKSEGREVQLNSFQWEKGVYLLVVKTDSGNSIHKIMK